MAKPAGDINLVKLHPRWRKSAFPAVPKEYSTVGGVQMQCDKERAELTAASQQATAFRRNIGRAMHVSHRLGPGFKCGGGRPGRQMPVAAFCSPIARQYPPHILSSDKIEISHWAVGPDRDAGTTPQLKAKALDDTTVRLQLRILMEWTLLVSRVYCRPRPFSFFGA